ncbi:MAG: DUF3791 domain-containing protein [Paludibacteraceae bacterium]|nr:DUF3791 domain-containing protein [Paludibacteraceae bacterium]
MLNNLNMWNKIGRIVKGLSDRLDIDILKAFDIFYSSDTCKNLHNPHLGLYLLGDICIVDELIKEIREKDSLK